MFSLADTYPKRVSSTHQNIMAWKSQTQSLIGAAKWKNVLKTHAIESGGGIPLMREGAGITRNRDAVRASTHESPASRAAQRLCFHSDQ